MCLPGVTFPPGKLDKFSISFRSLTAQLASYLASSFKSRSAPFTGSLIYRLVNCLDLSYAVKFIAQP